MTLNLPSHDALPYIDPVPTPSQQESTTALLAAELPPDHATALHPSLPDAYEPHFTPLIKAAHDSIASSGAPRAPDTGIDMSRYEEPSAPEAPSDAAEWRQALRAAHTSHAYLAQRAQNLALLERYGKNAWLIGNAQVEAELAALERELAEARAEVEAVEEQRRRRQEGVKGEIEGLEGAWRDGVGRAVRVEVAVEGLKEELERRRRGGV